MKMISIENIVKFSIYPLCIWASIFEVQAQSMDGTTIKLSLSEAISHAKESNKLIGVLKAEESAAQLDVEDAKIGALPRILSNASYQRYSKITLYDGVLGDSRKMTKPPNANAGALGLETVFNLYSGGRQQYIINDFQRKSEMAAINTQEQAANIGLQVALQYLEMFRFYFQEQLIKDQIARARTRSKDIAALYANGKVTKSDVLRADVLLSNVLLSETANANDYIISNQKLNTFLNLDERTKITPIDTTSLNLPDSLEVERLLKDYSGTYVILKAQKNIEIQENRIRQTKSSYLPSVTLFGGYGFNYPNTLIFPPKPQTFAVGTVGVRLSYDISSLYQNKFKVKSARLRETELRQHKDWIADNVRQEATALAIKYSEAINRMLVIEKSIEQAESNYNIQNTKYFNQLSLLTDLLEADNLYQESRFNYIQANIAALSIYYRLLFITGNL